jgi:hypothetical protein
MFFIVLLLRVARTMEPSSYPAPHAARDLALFIYQLSERSIS